MYDSGLSIKRLDSWAPLGFPAPHNVPGATQVGTNGRGAVIWIPPNPQPRKAIPSGAPAAMRMRPPKLMMDPLDRATWQRPYRFT